MDLNEFSSQLAIQLASLSPIQRIAFGLDICKRLYPDYLEFFQEYQWGNPEILKRSIDYTGYAMNDEVDEQLVNGLMDELDLVIPDTEEFGDFLTSYAINAACAVWELLEYLLDQDQTHLMHISNMIIDTIDFKLQEKDNTLTADELSRHPMIIAEWTLQLEQAK
ncbi:DUF416 family protein [Pedobacter sp. BMA]|uniref:DUF416 family protein n=1 Tax=Pedobacter sp. BMA TaxID=1663685 RepID=UPI00064A0489|nr:DUF416 family protein [Pedobacter sp. BMA]KLT63762.1 hypothetical protein AB669_20155 [Pedobacter sp. BMA]